MTDEDERIINRVIALVSNDWQDEREDARGALHRLFRKVRALENENEALRSCLTEADRTHTFYRYHKGGKS